MEIVIVGRVVLGRGEGKKFIALGWVKKQIQEKIGFTPFEGTLNLTLEPRFRDIYQSFVRPRKGIPIEPITSQFSSGKCFKVIINEQIRGAIVIPLLSTYPSHQIEVISPVNLRSYLRLADGHTVTLNISNSTRHYDQD
jgi:riboflavin kinase